MTTSTDPRVLPALLQLASAALPVGAFSHSLGLEMAQESGVVHDASSAERWIADYLALVWATGDAPLWRAQYAAWQAGDAAAIRTHNDTLLAMRETAELRLESEQTGRSLSQWLQALPELPALDATRRAVLDSLRPPAYISVHACATQLLDIDETSGLHALAWSLAENLTTAAVKLVPLGQVAGQAILRRIAGQLPQLVARALAHDPSQATNFAPMLGILSARHETQYTRLFRS
jgi:urease accessory protein